MKQIPRAETQVSDPAGSPEALAARPGNLRSLIIAAAVLLLCFSVPLFDLVRFALSHDLYSYIILIPFVSAYLVWLNRSQAGSGESRPSAIWALGFFAAGAGVLIVYFQILLSAKQPAQQDALALAMYSLVLLLAGVCCRFLDRPTLRAVSFPLGFLVFLAPLPVAAEAALETFLQHKSSVVAQAFFQIIGTPVFREGTLFQLPGFSMQVAPECSGIHSTLALFVTSLVAGQLLLRSTWSRAILTLAVLPIALLRNGLRVATIGELCVRIGPEMIDSYIHRHGGPIFFALSLIPFSLLLLLLIKYDGKRASPVNPIA